MKVQNNYVIDFLIIYITSFIPSLFIWFIFKRPEAYYFAHSFLLITVLYFVDKQRLINILSLCGLLILGGEFVVTSVFPYNREEFSFYYEYAIYGANAACAIFLLREMYFKVILRFNTRQ